jgi:hypothetical protein
MKITNKSPKGKWIHVKINGYSYKKWVAGYDSIVLAEVTNKKQLNLNAHEEAMIHAESHGIVDDPSGHKKEVFYFMVQATSGAHGTTSLSGSSASVLDGMNLAFSVYPAANYYLSAYTVNGIAQATKTPSASTVYTLSNITQDKNISVAFAAYGS